MNNYKNKSKNNDCKFGHGAYNAASPSCNNALLIEVRRPAQVAFQFQQNVVFIRTILLNVDSLLPDGKFLKNWEPPDEDALSAG